MTARDDFDRPVWLIPGERPDPRARAPAGQVFAQTARTRRRPGWLVPRKVAFRAPRHALAGRAARSTPRGGAGNPAGAPRRRSAVSRPSTTPGSVRSGSERPHRVHVRPADSRRTNRWLRSAAAHPAAEVAGGRCSSPLGRRISTSSTNRPVRPFSPRCTRRYRHRHCSRGHPIGWNPSTPSWSPDEQFLVFSQPTSRAGATGSSSSRPCLGSRQAGRPRQRRHWSGALTRRPAHRILPNQSRSADVGGHGRTDPTSANWLPSRWWRDAARRNRLRMVA